MPEIKRQLPPKPKPAPTVKTASGLEIVPVQSIDTGIKLNIYGRGKTGKTSFACSFPKPLLIMGTEDGTKSVRSQDGVFFARITESAQIAEATDLCRQGKYATAVIDTAGGLQDLILKEVLGLKDIPVQRSWGMAKRDDWMATGAQVKERLNPLLDLADRSAFNVVIIAHERNFGEEEAQSDVMLPSVGSAVIPSLAGWLNGACDFVVQMYIREQVEIKQVKIGQAVTEQRRKTGKKEHCLRIGAHPIFMTGFRADLALIKALPDEIIDPSYAKLIALLNRKA